MKHEVVTMHQTGGGAIVNTSSAFGLVSGAYASLYVGTKFAVEGLSKSIVAEVIGQNIRVNTVAPGAVQTDMIDRFAGKQGPAREGLIAKHPIGRYGTSEEIAAAVLYLCMVATPLCRGNAGKETAGFQPLSIRLSLHMARLDTVGKC